MAEAELSASMEAAVTLTPAATSNGTEHPEASSTTMDNDTEMVDQVDDNNDDTMEDEEQRGEKRKRSLSPNRLDKLAKARSMRKFSKSKRKRAVSNFTILSSMLLIVITATCTKERLGFER